MKSAQIIQQLQEQNALLRQELAKRDEIIAELRAENALLRQKVDLLIRRVFGSSSEKLDAQQLDLLILNSPPPEPVLGKACATPCLEEEVSPQVSRQVKERTLRLPADLPVVEEVIEPREVQQDPQPWKFIGAEVSELLDYQPAKFFRRRLVRNKYVRRDDKQAPPVIPDGNSALMLVAARLRQIASTHWSTKRYMDMNRLHNANLPKEQNRAA